MRNVLLLCAVLVANLAFAASSEVESLRAIAARCSAEWGNAKDSILPFSNGSVYRTQFAVVDTEVDVSTSTSLVAPFSGTIRMVRKARMSAALSNEVDAVTAPTEPGVREATQVYVFSYQFRDGMWRQDGAKITHTYSDDHPMKPARNLPTIVTREKLLEMPSPWKACR